MRNVRKNFPPLPNIVLWGMSAYMIVWGIWVGNTYWDVFMPNSAIIDVLNYISEDVFGMLMLVWGAMLGFGVYFKLGWMKRFAEFGGLIWWLLIANSYFVGNWQSTLGITYLAASLLYSYAYITDSIKKDS